MGLLGVARANTAVGVSPEIIVSYHYYYKKRMCFIFSLSFKPDRSSLHSGIWGSPRQTAAPRRTALVSFVAARDKSAVNSMSWLHNDDRLLFSASCFLAAIEVALERSNARQAKGYSMSNLHTYAITVQNMA
jgi:hypothetical protein